MWLFESLQNMLGPFYERRQQIEGRKDAVMDVLNEGSKKAKAVAGETMQQVREAIKI
jgi:tryptophanyl-tRNA synthetase